MLTKFKTAFSKFCATSRLKIAAITVMLTSCMTPFVYATTGGSEGETATIKNLVNLVLTIFRYIGVLLLCWSVGMLVLAFKNEDADSKSRAIMLLVVSIALMGLKTLISAIVPSEYMPS